MCWISEKKKRGDILIEKKWKHAPFMDYISCLIHKLGEGGNGQNKRTYTKRKIFLCACDVTNKNDIMHKVKTGCVIIPNP
mmetsp:Transcript_21010/g.37961  ORF Transcript_21010/g.37961 Transcript_21010/m.37961 type:complete len:80 (-) Transcript_21010:1562-1801(-)